MSEDKFLSWLVSNRFHKDIDVLHIHRLEVIRGIISCMEEAEFGLKFHVPAVVKVWIFLICAWNCWI